MPAEASMSAPIDAARVRAIFSRPDRVIESAFLRREISNRMFERLALVRLDPSRVVDAGCGAGADLPALKKHYPQAQVIGLDAAQAMLQEARSGQHAALSSMNRLLLQLLPARLNAARGLDAGLLCADFARLPMAPNAAELVWSNLALHWHPQPDRVFAEWRRILRVDGLLMFSCFGPDTFRQLRSAFASAGAPEAGARVLPFVDMHDFGDMLVQAGFSTPVMDMETITVTYESTDRLLADVRAWGGNPLLSRPRGLLGRGTWTRFDAALDALRDADGKIPLTFEVIYGHAFRPVARTTTSGESIIRLDLRPK